MPPVSTSANQFGFILSGRASLWCAALLIASAVFVNSIDQDQHRRLVGVIGWLYNVPLLLTGTVCTVMALRHWHITGHKTVGLFRLLPFLAILGYVLVTMAWVIMHP
jgi:ATP/ADP translocase